MTIYGTKMNFNSIAVMKKLMKSLMLFAAAAMALTSCENEAMNEGIESNDTFTLSFTAGAPESKTAVKIDGDKAKFTWSEGDEVAFIQWANGAEKINKKKSGAAKIEGKTATFTSSFDKVEGTVTSYDYAAIYPETNWKSNISFAEVEAKLPAMQVLTADSFDPDADLMRSKAILGVEEKDGHGGNLEFTRIAAIGKMSLKLEGMVEDEIIESVKFAFAEGTHFNGPVVLDFVNITYTLGTEGTNNAVTLTGELAANADRTDIFFTCFPGEYSGAYTIEVETDKAKYSKNATLTNALSFKAGDVLGFKATVGDREEKVIAANEVVDVLNRDLTGATGTSYIEWSGKTSNSAAVYKGQSAGDKTSIQLRSKNSNSGIVTTTSGGTVKKVVVTWQSDTADGRTLNIYGKDSAYSAATDLYGNNAGTLIGEIKCGTSTELEINDNYTHIGMRSADGAMYISQIEITWATGTSEGGETPDPKPTKLATPTNLQVVTKELEVSLEWDGSANATSYYVTCGDKSTTVTTTEALFTMDAAGTYDIKVVAKAEGYTDSDALTGTANVTVSTGGGENTTKYYVKVTSAPSDWSGTYLIVYEGTKIAFDGSLSSLDVSGNSKPVTISNSQIEATDAMNEISFTIAKSGSNYTIKSKSGYYVGQTSNANGLKSSTSTSYANTISINSDSSVNFVSGGAYLRYNAGSNDLRFRYYKSSTYTGQKAIQLYKLQD